MTNSERHPGDYRLHEEQVAPLVALHRTEHGQYECPHFPVPSGRWQGFWLRLADPHPELGEQTRMGAMCCACYQRLREAGVAPGEGTWER